jgi:hypothetical protein
MERDMNAIEKQKWVLAQDQEHDFIWGHFFNYCKSFYAKGGIYGDEVDATDHEIEVAILDVLDTPNHEFAGDTWDRELVRKHIEQNRRDNYARFAYRGIYQSMKFNNCLTDEGKNYV